MPHLTIEYSKNLDKQADVSRLCHALHETLLKTGLFEIGAIRVRAIVADYYAVADKRDENAFADMVFRIGVGRLESEKKQAGEAMMACAHAPSRRAIAAISSSCSPCERRSASRPYWCAVRHTTGCSIKLPNKPASRRDCAVSRMIA